MSKVLAAIESALAMQAEAAALGFDWDNVSPVFDKVKEEIQELESAVADADRDHIEAEFGDLLFAVLNLSRHLDLDVDSALLRTNNKFNQRFAHVQKRAEDERVEMAPNNLALLEAFWQEAKRREGDE